MFKTLLNITYSLLVSVFFVGCENVFDFSPYQANIKDEYENQTSKNIGDLLINQITPDRSLTFVTISDSHLDYYELEKAIDKINSMDDIDFVIHLGDFTNKGLLMEYEIFSENIRKLNVPLLTAIGNHDYLSNGGIVYEKMFGDYNYTILYNGVKLVFFDGTFFESGKGPDMNWLKEQLTIDSLPKIIFSHIAPWDQDYKSDETDVYKELVETSPVIVSMHGHHHNYFYGSPLDTEMQFLIPGSISNGKICKVQVDVDNTYSFEMISF